MKNHKYIYLYNLLKGYKVDCELYLNSCEST